MHKLDQSIHRKMEELRMVCEREIPIQEHRQNNAKTAFRNSLQSTKVKAQQAARDQVKLGQLRAQLRELEDDLVKALAVKTRKEAKHMAISDSISAVKVRREETKKILQDRKARKDEYAAIQLLAMETLQERANKGAKQKQDIEEAISWYNRVLGFRIEAGPGVKFIFNNINLKNPTEEYSFTIRHSDDTYTLLHCDPHLDATKELIKELNQTNGLFKFVRVMREKFQTAALTGVLLQTHSIHQDSATVSISAPASSVSVDVTESPTTDVELQAQSNELRRSPKRVNRGQGQSASKSPGSGSSLRRSSRHSKVKKMTN